MAAYILAAHVEVCFRKVLKPLMKYPSDNIHIVLSCHQIPSYSHQTGTIIRIYIDMLFKAIKRCSYVFRCRLFYLQLQLISFSNQHQIGFVLGNIRDRHTPMGPWVRGNRVYVDNNIFLWLSKRE